MMPISVRHALARVAYIFAMSSFTCAVIFGQAVSQISGTVTDASGAVVPGVQVVATQTDTGAKRTAESDAAGAYLFTNLPVGPYRIEASKSGFRTYAQSGIVLQVNSNPEVPITLNVGQTSETVEVTANAIAVDTRSMGVGSVVENQRILDLPLNGRQPTDLIALAGAAVQTGTSSTFHMQTGIQISVAGGQVYGVGYFLDGGQFNDPYDGTGMPLPFPDALQEFKVETSALTAQTGIHSGAAVSGVTKSGTNTLHGDAFEFFRNSDLNGKDPFSHTSDHLKRNQYGGVIGGAIKKDKLFFFGGYQGTVIRQTPGNIAAFVPTPAMLNGDFTAYMANHCAGSLTTLGAPFVNNQLDPSLVSQAAKNIAAKLPTGTGPCGATFYGNPVHENDYQGIGRVDYQLNEKHSIFGRYLATKQQVAVPYTLSGDLLSTATSTAANASYADGSDNLATAVTLGDTYLFNATTVNSFRAALNRAGSQILTPNFFTPQSVGINVYAFPASAGAGDFFTLAVPGSFAIAGGAFRDWDTSLAFNDDVSLAWGSHQFGFGVMWDQNKVIALTSVFSNGNLRPTGSQTGSAMADFIAGDIGFFTQQGITDEGLEQRFFGVYAMDTWKVNKRLTLNYGLRWDPYFPEQMKNSRIYSFTVAGFEAGVQSKVYPNAPPGMLFPGDAGYVNGQAGVPVQYKNFSPRFGFAFDPTGDGRTAIRGGAGIAYDFSPLQLLNISANTAPFGGRVGAQGTSPLNNPYATVPGGNSFPNQTGFIPFAQTVEVGPDLKTPEVYNWNLAVQRQISKSWFASVSYVGNHAIHMDYATELNAPQLIPGLPILANGNDPRCLQGVTTPGPVAANCSTNENQRRFLYLLNPTGAQNLGDVSQLNSVGTQMYNGLLTNTSWKPTRLVNLNANYTWSHCIGDLTAAAGVLSPGQVYTDANNRNLDRGDCVGDRRHIFNLTGVVQTPRFDNALARDLVSDWTVSGIYRAQSGAPQLITSGLDQALSGAGGLANLQRPNQILANAYGTGNQYLNPNAFAQPALGTIGNLLPYSVVGPRFWQFDMAVVRAFQIRESQRLEVRGEAFNILNKYQPNALTPFSTALNTPTFGQILSAQPPRVIQFALKYVF